ncbi:MAG TPA: DUF5666 domain-containing protein, partial [Alphaproteobacteria bacterium]|nr:DUF5666 domain-containing protein [Alphaproteobacteria bacterium]
DRTHIDEKGIGGTGSPYKTVHIRGTVYAFGSMCVNGLRVHYGDITKVSDSNGNSLFHKSILLGHVVDIRASVNPEDNSLHAQEVTVHGFSSGKVTKILEDEQSFILDNQQVVHLADEALFKLVKIGQSYEVTGMLDDKNILSASLIELLDETSPSQISENGALLAQADLMNSIGDYFSIEGYIEGVKENNVVNVSGIDYQVTTLECGDGPITVGERVIAMGKVLEDGSMRIEGFIDIHEPKIFTQK